MDKEDEKDEENNKEGGADEEDNKMRQTSPRKIRRPWRTTIRRRTGSTVGKTRLTTVIIRRT